jgi:hypothetical protein
MAEPPLFVRRLAWGFLLLLAAFQAWTFRHTVSPDGVAYLDLSDAVVNGTIRDLINGYWSPVYPLVVGIARWVVSPTPLAAPYWEFAILHAVNFLGFVLALAAFDWFISAVRIASVSWGRAALTSRFGLSVAYALFGAAMLVMVSVSGTVPDLFLSAAVFAACACLVSLHVDPRRRKTAIVLGLVLAAGALTKSIMFPLAFVMLTCLAIATLRQARAAAMTAAAIFALATLPWCVAVSLAVGRPSIGETGALNFAWYVNHQQPPNTGVMPKLAQPLPQDALPLDGVAILHETRGTNPLWYDPARWHADVRPRFQPGQVIARIGSNASYFLAVLSPLLLLAVSIAAAAPWQAVRSTLARSFVVFVPSMAAIAAYATTYATARYVAAFLVVSSLILVAAFPRDLPLRRDRLILAAAVMLLLIDALSPLRGRVLVAYAVAVFAATYASWGRVADWRRWPLSILSAGVILWLLVVLPSAFVRGLTLVVGLGGWYWFARRERAIAPLTATSDGPRALVVAGVAGVLIMNLLTGWHAVLRLDGADHTDWDASQRVIQAGVPPGSKIAVLGNPETAAWARLARYRIVAIIPDARVSDFLRLPVTERQRLMNAFQGAGATQLIRAAP